MSLRALTSSRVTLLVADGKGSCELGGVAIIDVGRSALGRLGRVILGSLKVWQALRKLKPDVVHLHDPELLPLGLALRICGVMVIYDMHENLPKQIRTKEWLPVVARGLLCRLVALVERAILPWLAVVFAELSYRSDYPWIRRYEVVLNLPKVNVLRMIERKRHHVATLGYIGAVTVQRGALVVLEAVRMLRNEGVNVNFLCVGQVDDAVASDPLFSSAQREGWARFYGRLPPTDGWEILAACKIGLAVLAPSPNYLESYPTKMFEYMALGMPVVVSDFPLYRQVVEGSGCGLLVDPLDFRAVSSAVRWLLEHPIEAGDMGRRGRLAVMERYSWDCEAEKLVAFYGGVKRLNSGDR